MNPSHRASGIQWNRKALAAVCGLGAVILYVLYSVPWQREDDRLIKPWKSRQPIPQHVLDLQGKVVVEEKEIEVAINDKVKIKVFYREAQSALKEDGFDLPVILLHGAGDNSEKWEKLGTMHLVSAMGHRIVAVDLPGWGRTKDTIDRSQEKLFLKPFLENILMEKPVIVAASYGGNYAIPYLMEPEADTCYQRARGFVPIATTSTGRYKPAQYHRCSVPSMLVFGVNDTHLGLGMVGDLRNLLNNVIEPVEKAGHAVMFQQPEKFHSLMYNFINSLASSSKLH